MASVAAVIVVLHLVGGCDRPAPSASSSGPPPPPVTVARPVVKDIVEWDSFVGRFEAVDSVDVRARVSGYLDAIRFKEGSIVQKGDVLFTIDPRPYQAAVDRAEAAVKESEAKLQFATTELERARALRTTGNTPERTLDQRQQEFLAAQAELNGARAAVEQARLDLGFTAVHAPLTGRISRKFVSEGNLVNANETILTTIVSLDPIHFYFDVDERSYLAYVRMARDGTRPSGRETPHPVVVTLSDRQIPPRDGHLDFVDNRVDADTGTMRGRALFANDDLILTPGLFGRVSIPGSGSYAGVLIPDEAVGSDQDRRIVYLVGDDGKVTTRVVRLGPRIDGYRVVREGLTGEDVIVVDGLMRVRPGMKVNPHLTELPPIRS